MDKNWCYRVEPVTNMASSKRQHALLDALNSAAVKELPWLEWDSHADVYLDGVRVADNWKKAIAGDWVTFWGDADGPKTSGRILAANKVEIKLGSQSCVLDIQKIVDDCISRHRAEAKARDCYAALMRGNVTEQERTEYMEAIRKAGYSITYYGRGRYGIGGKYGALTTGNNPICADFG